MDIFTANSITTTTFTTKFEEINIKYKKEREELKKVIAKTARSQAEQILTNEDDDMGNPEELCNKLTELRLKYNTIVVKQKQETDVVMNEYKGEIITNMGSIKWLSNEIFSVQHPEPIHGIHFCVNGNKNDNIVFKYGDKRDQNVVCSSSIDTSYDNSCNYWKSIPLPSSGVPYYIITCSINGVLLPVIDAKEVPRLATPQVWTLAWSKYKLKFWKI